MDSVQLVAKKRRPVGHRMIKFPGGAEKYPGEPPALIANREVCEETSLAYLVGEEVWSAKSNDHTKYGYMVYFEDCSGEIRTWDIPDGDEMLEPPRWVRARDLKGKIFEGGELFYESVCRRLKVF
ncbi:MAG: hypothetical protein A2832_01195 [Candidatus Zambryskibacteria bacterium RIFCSPHIGHO2_01_FULL_44_22b]|uniref:Uncharacterized protein n=2 Tax=Candidatus Zambryskiibacteriota TaxID=1817925 RepID=A0A1G2SXR0_9BACT|nr:MAG: hypothetical protein A2832_01195 [Candidatus Zambryskibacteria bacterium RIFCSPHIGHO2_01_FULL_44_22b]OHB04881.1 MAG: hypothetical protein A3B16_01570 [Candidatus Zambryskibacteria bacterium RIFCSPLOWO2_01_FULL_45_43]